MRATICRPHPDALYTHAPFLAAARTGAVGIIAALLQEGQLAQTTAALNPDWGLRRAVALSDSERGEYLRCHKEANCLRHM